jgi:pimeloyl-ACP methyl ester carboxylesterase
MVLIGYSGGGVIATLAAERMRDVKVLVTIAANLDIDAWTDYHGYDQLLESTNPASQPPLRSSLDQYHFFGADDRIVPVAIMHRFFDKNTDSTLREISGFDHICCWEAAWTDLLMEITNNKPSTIYGTTDEALPPLDL